MPELFRIKPLEWRQFNSDGSYGAWTPFGYARVFRPLQPPGENRWVYQLDYFGRENYPCASPEEGKQLAEQHWQEYVKQALVPVETEQSQIFAPGTLMIQVR